MKGFNAGVLYDFFTCQQTNFNDSNYLRGFNFKNKKALIDEETGPEQPAESLEFLQTAKCYKIICCDP
jgi:hypothetical protein